MFRKLIANLPFSPALVGQLGFYAKRLKKEQGARQLGLIFTALAVAVQSFALIQPPEAANAAGYRDCAANSIMQCGAMSVAEFRQKYAQNAPKDLPSIYNHFGLTSNVINNSRVVEGIATRDGRVIVNDRVVATSAQSLGRNNGTGSRTPVQIAGTTYFSSPNRDIYLSDTISAYIWLDANGRFIAGVLRSCGNPILATPTSPPPVTVPPTPPVLPPATAVCTGLSVETLDRTNFKLTATSAASNGAAVRSYQFSVKTAAGNTAYFREIFNANNRVSTDATLRTPGTYRVTVTLNTTVGPISSTSCVKPLTVVPPAAKPPVADCSSLTVKKINRSRFEFIAKGTTDNGASISRIDFYIRDNKNKLINSEPKKATNNSAGVTLNIAQTGTFKAQAYIISSIGNKTSAACVKSFTVTPPPPTPVASCDSLKVSTIERTKYKLVARGSVSGGASISRYEFTVYDSAKKAVTTTRTDAKSNIGTTNVTVTTPGTYTVKVVAVTSVGNKTDADCEKPLKVSTPEMCPLNPSLPVSSPECKPCEGDNGIWYNDDECKPEITLMKQAINLSQGGVDATTVTAKPGDRIQYTLIVKNTGTLSQNQAVNDKLSDLLEYSTIQELGGGTFDQTGKVVDYGQIKIEPDQPVSRSFTVQVLNAIPASPGGIGDNVASYDCKMSNLYGNIVDVPVQCPPEKGVETVIKELPSTGPGENMLFSAVVLMVVTYFFARAKQKNKEVKLIRHDFNMGTI